VIITTDQLGKRIKSEEDRLFLLYGQEDFFIDLAVNSIKRKYLAKGFETMDYIKLDFGGKKVDTEAIASNAELVPWASGKRIVEVVNFDVDRDGADNLIKIFDNIPDTTLLLFKNETFDKRKKKLFEAFDKKGVVCEVAHLSEDRLMQFITKKFKDNEIGIEYEAAQSIISRYDSSMRMIDSAVKRINIYADATGIKNIDMSVVDELCEPDVYGDIFKIMDAVAAKNAAEALVLLDNLIKMKEPVTKIRFMIARRVRELICAKEIRNKNQLAARIGARGFVADKLIKQASCFKMPRLIKLYELCYRMDYDIKHGTAEERESLEAFIVLASQA